jgi:hypothetical protein
VSVPKGAGVVSEVCGGVKSLKETLHD